MQTGVTAAGSHMRYGITQCYLPPPGRGDISTFTQMKVVLDVATTGATMEGYRLS